jgi:hypothetical protein
MKVSADKHYLVDDADKPFFYLADTAWMLFYHVSREDADFYLQNRRQKGFTVVMPVMLRESPGTGMRNFYGDSPFVDDDPTRPNEAFFQNVDWVIQRAADLGLHVAILPTWGDKVGPLWMGDQEPPNFDPTKFGPIIFNTNNARVYGEFLGRRYREQPIIWVLGGDRNPIGAEYVAVWRALAEGLRAGDGGRHLMTYHCCSVGSSSRWLHDETWLDFNMMQTTTRWDLDNYNLVLADYNRAPTKPTLDGETRYEDSHEWFSRLPSHGRRITAHQVRKAAYNAMLSGALGHTYGCRDVWYFYAPSSEIPPRDVKTHWKKAMDFPGAFQMGYLRKLFTDYPFHKLVPDQERKIVTHGSGERGAYVPAARADGGAFALAYVPERMPIWVDLRAIASERVRAVWFNPRTGAYAWQGDYVERGVMRFDPPTSDPEPDYVLVLEKSSKGISNENSHLG